MPNDARSGEVPTVGVRHESEGQPAEEVIARVTIAELKERLLAHLGAVNTDFVSEDVVFYPAPLCADIANVTAACFATRCSPSVSSGTCSGFRCRYDRF